MCSLILCLKAGHRAEIGTAGNEGVVGISALLGMRPMEQSHMVAATRPRVSEAARMRLAGLIDYYDGLVRILDRRGLEETSCECYAATRFPVR